MTKLSQEEFSASGATSGDFAVLRSSVWTAESAYYADLAYEEDAVSSTTTSATYVEASSFTTPSLGGATYLLAVSFSSDGRGGTVRHDVRIQVDDTTTIHESSTYPDSKAGSIYDRDHYIDYVELVLSAGTHTIDFDHKRGAGTASDVEITAARYYLWRVA